MAIEWDLIKMCFLQVRYTKRYHLPDEASVVSWGLSFDDGPTPGQQQMRFSFR